MAARAEAEPAGAPSTCARPPVAAHEAARDLRQRRLPGPVRAEQTEQLAALHLQVHPAERDGRAVALLERLAGEDGRHRPQCRKLTRVPLTDQVREGCRSIAESARFVSIDLDRLVELDPGPPPELDADRHYLEGTPEDVADYMLALDAINFGSGWFPTLRKRPGCSGYFTVAASLADRWRSVGPWSPDELRAWTRHRGCSGARAGAGPRADGAVRRGAARSWPLPRRPPGARRRRRGRRLGRAAGVDACRWHALLRRPRLLEARPDHAQRPRARRRGRVLRPRPPDDLRGQPRAARASRRRRAPLRPRARRPH